jgi:hypothetical protein
VADLLKVSEGCWAELHQGLTIAMKTFLNTRAISHSGTGDILRQLYSDYPSRNPAVRLVVIISIFIAAESSRSDTLQIHSNLEAAGLTPLTRDDMYHVLINPFVEKYTAVIDYASEEVGVNDLDGDRGMSEPQIDELIQDVAKRCLEIGCKVGCSAPRFLLRT